jgi:endonuclease YncB( thermonuclease family)
MICGNLYFCKYALSALLAVASLAATGETLSGRVISVADGDTITVLDASDEQHKIRLAGIDAPEKSQPYGQVAKQSLSDLVYGRQADIETNKRDRYGRKIGKVLVDGADANLEQIRRGLAWHYKAYELEQPPLDRATYADAEIEARDASRGLWGDPTPVAPWEWRHNKAAR